MSKPRVAILGASGIGKFHARDFNNSGCDVVAILGSSRSTSEATAEMLSSDFNIQARPYHNLEVLLSTEELDAVSVCTPPEQHASQVRTCLKAGLHVLCEKPFVLDNLSDNYAIVRELVDLAHSQGKVLTVNTQWQATLPYLLKALNTNEVSSIGMYMEPGFRGDILIPDGLPHLNSLLIKHLPFGNTEQVNVESTDEEAKIQFQYISSKGSCEAECLLKHKADRPRKLSFTINGTEFIRQIGPNYSQQFVYDGNVIAVPDPFTKSIESFVSSITKNKEPMINERDILDSARIQDSIMKAYLSQKS